MSDNAEFGTVIHQLLSATSPEEAARLLRDFPWLTSKEISHKLTRMVAEKRCERNLLGMTCLMACRGFLHRCRNWENVDKALAAQPGWPLYNQGPLNQLLALPGTAPADERMHWANLASDDVDPEEPDFRGLIDYHLGWGYQIKAEEGSNDALDQAIAHFEKAEAAWQWEDSIFGGCLLGLTYEYLGRLYLERRHGKRGQDVEAALSWLQKAYRTFEDTPSKQLALSMLLGKAYLGRVQKERLWNIEEGIYYYHKAHALAEQTDEEERLGEIEHSLAFAYRLRMQGDPADNYEQARGWAERALARFDRHEAPEEWARTRVELATIYAHHHQGNRDANLETAIDYAQEALEVYRPDTHLRQGTLVQLILGNLYCDRISGIRAENDQQAIRCFRNVLKHCDPESEPLRWSEAMNNLGTVYAGRSRRLNDEDYRQAVDCYRKALRVRTPDRLPAQALQTAANWGNLDFWFGNWARASKAFEKALKAGKALYQASSTEAGRRAELAETWQLVARAAYCWLRRKRPDRALLELEGGKARLLAEALALGDSDLDMLPNTQREAVLGARQTIRKLEAEMRLPQDAPGRREDRVLAQRLQRARADLDQLVQTIRAKSPDFMPTGLDLPGILKQIPEGGALVAPLVTLRGSAVFILPAGTRRFGAEHVIPLDAFTDQDLNALLIGTPENPGWLRAYAAWRDGGSLQDWKTAVETFTGQLWEALIEPIYQRLSELGLTEGAPVILMPQGGLGLLPLHAAWRWVNGVQCAFLDDYIVSYAPSAYTLSVSQRRMEDPRRHQPVLLAVVNPTGNLPYAPLEGGVVAKLFPPTARRMLVESDAIRYAVVQKAPGCTYLHFSCHGSYGWQDAMHSALALAGDNPHGDPFTLSEIISSLDLSTARLVTLSACETGLTEFQQSPDEYIGLPAGFLQAGVPGVVSTLWAVNDLSTTVLMESFYQHHRKIGLAPAAALRVAQRWLRDVTNSELGEIFDNYLQAATPDQPWLNRGKIKKKFREFTLHPDPDGKPFAHPYYWAAFTFTGV